MSVIKRDFPGNMWAVPAQEYYRIYSINRPGRLLKFLDLEGGRLFEVGAHSRLGAY